MTGSHFERRGDVSVEVIGRMREDGGWRDVGSRPAWRTRMTLRASEGPPKSSRNDCVDSSTH